jgi:hypothetical protein
MSLQTQERPAPALQRRTLAHVLGKGDVPQGVEQQNAGLKITFDKQGKYWAVRLNLKVLFGQFSGDALHRKPGYPHPAQPAEPPYADPHVGGVGALS